MRDHFLTPERALSLRCATHVIESCVEPFHQAMTYTMMDQQGRHSSEKMDTDVVQAHAGNEASTGLTTNN